MLIVRHILLITPVQYIVVQQSNVTCYLFRSIIRHKPFNGSKKMSPSPLIVLLLSPILECKVSATYFVRMRTKKFWHQIFALQTGMVCSNCISPNTIINQQHHFHNHGSSKMFCHFYSCNTNEGQF